MQDLQGKDKEVLHFPLWVQDRPAGCSGAGIIKPPLFVPSGIKETQQGIGFQGSIVYAQIK